MDTDARDGIGADDRLPLVGFGQRLGNAALAPRRVGVTAGNHLGVNRLCHAVRVVGCRRREDLQAGRAVGVAARLPVLEGATTAAGNAAGFGDVADLFPGLEYEAALLRRGGTELGTIGCHTWYRSSM